LPTRSARDRFPVLRPGEVKGPDERHDGVAFRVASSSTARFSISAFQGPSLRTLRYPGRDLRPRGHLGQQPCSRLGSLRRADQVRLIPPLNGSYSLVRLLRRGPCVDAKLVSGGPSTKLNHPPGASFRIRVPGQSGVLRRCMTGRSDDRDLRPEGPFIPRPQAIN
jgi:hypothetical protein